MWIFLSDAFFSVVANRDDHNELMVRARLPGHLEKHFPGIPVQELDQADYRFRISVPRELVQGVLDHQVETLTYSNFKDSVEDQELHDHYLGVWQVMMRAQEQSYPTPLLGLEDPFEAAGFDYIGGGDYYCPECQAMQSPNDIRRCRYEDCRLPKATGDYTDE